MDDVTALQQLTPQVMAQEAALLESREAVLWKPDIRLRRSMTGSKTWRGESAPQGTAISYHLKSAAGGPVKLTVTDPISGEVFRTLEAPGQAGLNRVHWDLCSDRRPLQAGQFDREHVSVVVLHQIDGGRPARRATAEEALERCRRQRGKLTQGLQPQLCQLLFHRRSEHRQRP